MRFGCSISDSSCRMELSRLIFRDIYNSDIGFSNHDLRKGMFRVFAKWAQEDIFFKKNRLCNLCYKMLFCGKKSSVSTPFANLQGDSFPASRASSLIRGFLFVYIDSWIGVAAFEMDTDKFTFIFHFLLLTNIFRKHSEWF